MKTISDLADLNRNNLLTLVMSKPFPSTTTNKICMLSWFAQPGCKSKAFSTATWII